MRNENEQDPTNVNPIELDPTDVTVELDPQEDQDPQDPAGEEGDPDGSGGIPPAEGEDEGDDDLVLTLDDGNEIPDEDEDDEGGEPDAKAPDWVKKTRQANKELNKTVRELKKELEAAKAQSQTPPTPPATTLSEKPTLDECGYDTDIFEEKLLEWNEQKRKIVQQQEVAKKADEQLQVAFQNKVKSYNERKSTIKVADFDGAEFRVKEALNSVKQGIIVDVADDPVQLVVVLGKNPTKLRELADIQNPLQFVKAITQLESKIKVSKKVKTPAPVDQGIKGTTSAHNDNRLEQLRAEADRTGDRSKVAAYLRAKRK
jgi:hypothetical protein